MSSRTRAPRGIRKMEPVFSNPMDVLVVKNAKYAKECTEVNLSNKQITKIANFVPFPYLEVLILNNNKLKRIDNLDVNFRIKELQIDKNLLTSLGGSIKKFKFIATLYAAENNIRNLDK
jgi:Leucine-rich repeat (LRR) protein